MVSFNRVVEWFSFIMLFFVIVLSICGVSVDMGMLNVGVVVFLLLWKYVLVIFYMFCYVVLYLIWVLVNFLGCGVFVVRVFEEL